MPAFVLRCGVHELARLDPLRLSWEATVPPSLFGARSLIAAGASGPQRWLPAHWNRTATAFPSMPVPQTNSKSRRREFGIFRMAELAKMLCKVPLLFTFDKDCPVQLGKQLES